MSVHTDVSAKASYTRMAGRALQRYAWRKRDIDSEISNATAIGRLTQSLTLVGLGEAFEQAFDAAEKQLIDLRKASVINWRVKKEIVDAALVRVRAALSALEAQLERNEAQDHGRKVQRSGN